MPKILTNGSAEIANYSVFIITVKEVSVSNSYHTFAYHKGQSQYFSSMTTNGVYEYWLRFYIGITGNTFAASVNYASVLNATPPGTSLNAYIAAIVGVC